jgi:phosphopantothenoylcysteine decarboxylase/phosphopantothenate--cysteine ligase
VLVTAGGTREPIDPVRFVGNRSSGKQGHALAEEAAARGAQVTLITTVDRPVSGGIDVVRVDTAAEMEAAVEGRADAADVIVMAAAVADYRPAQPVDGKRVKDSAVWTIELEATADILAELDARRREGQVLIGFAAEYGEGAVERARGKLERKGADMIVMNDISRSDIGFDSSLNEIVLVSSKGDQLVSRRSKQACAAAILDTLGNQTAGAAVEQRTTV